MALGTIHLRRRHSLGGEGSKICQICQRIVVKNYRRQGVGVKNHEKFADVLNGWSLRDCSVSIPFIDYIELINDLQYLVSHCKCFFSQSYLGAIVAMIHQYGCCYQLFVAHCSILHFLYQTGSKYLQCSSLGSHGNKLQSLPFGRTYITLPKRDPLAKKNTS